MSKAVKYLVYLNKSYGAWATDAQKWCESEGIDPDKEYKEIISEVCFHAYVESGEITPFTSVHFVKDILTKRPT